MSIVLESIFLNAFDPIRPAIIIPMIGFLVSAVISTNTNNASASISFLLSEGCMNVSMIKEYIKLFILAS